MIIDHIGIVVRSIEEGLHHWERLFGYTRKSDIVENSRQAVKVVFLQKTDSLTIKLVEPVDEKSPIGQFARRGGGFHHICFRCKDLDDGIESLTANGARMIVSPQFGEAFEDDIAFLWAEGLNIELIDTTNKKGCPPDSR